MTLGNGSAHVELESFGGTIALRRPGEPRPETEREKRRERDQATRGRRRCQGRLDAAIAAVAGVDPRGDRTMREASSPKRSRPAEAPCLKRSRACRRRCRTRSRGDGVADANAGSDADPTPFADADSTADIQAPRAALRVPRDLGSAAYGRATSAASSSRPFVR